MVNTSKIDKAKLVYMVNEGKKNPEIAAYFGCSIWAVEHAKKAIRKKADNLPLAPNALEDKSISVIEQLSEANETILKELRRCGAFILREENKLKEFDRITEELVKNPENEELQLRLRRLDDSPTSTLKIQNNLIAIAGEIRKHAELNIKIAETLYSLQMNQEFQNTIIQVIREADPKTAEKLVTKLKEMRAIRGLVRN